MNKNEYNTTNTKKIQNELKRLKKYEEEYNRIINSSSYKWVKLMETEFIQGNLTSKFKFLYRLLKTGIKYLIITPLKKLIGNNSIYTSKSNKDYPDINIACILDTFSYSMFKDSANLYQLTPSNWKKAFKKKQFKMLLVESVWSGYKNTWLGFRNKSHNNNNDLYKIVSLCKKMNIPTVFWNKEDPVYFDSYIEYAKHFDFIFTTDVDIIDKYKSIVKHENVFPLIFGINPKIHNPINRKTFPDKDIIFAGTYYAYQEDRVKDLELVMEPSLKFNIDIFSRHPQNINQKEYRFPDKYQPYIKGSIHYLKMIEKYKEYKIMLNVNTVQNSSSMFSRRVVEAMACETLVISSYNKAIENIFGKLIPMVYSKKETSDLLNKYIHNHTERIRLIKKCQRIVFNNHTVKHRLNKILKKVNINIIENNEKISIITVTNRIKYINRIIDNFTNQTYQNKELILIINSEDFDKNIFTEKMKHDKNVKIYQLNKNFSLGYCTNYAIENSNGIILAKFDDDDIYSPYYLEDIFNAYQYSNASIIGKNRYFCYIEGKNMTVLSRMSNKIEENQYTKGLLLGATLTWKRSVNEKGIVFGDKNMGEDTIFLKRAHQKGINVYSTDRYGYIKWKSPNMSEHAWKISDEDIIKNSDFIFSGLNTDNVLL